MYRKKDTPVLSSRGLPAMDFGGFKTFVTFPRLTQPEMSRHLYLVRHCEAAAKESRQDDKSRDLTAAGVKDALHLGAWLVKQNAIPDLLVSSSAERAQRTADLIAESLKADNLRHLSEDALYEASLRNLLDYVNNLEDNYRNVLLTGHNPAVSYFAEYLTKAEIGDMAPGSLVMIRFESGSWKEVSGGSGMVVRSFAG